MPGFFRFERERHLFTPLVCKYFAVATRPMHFVRMKELTVSKFQRYVFAFLLLTFTAGCQSAIWHELQPHRLWRLNRGPAPGNGALYSVPTEAESIEGVVQSVNE